MIYFNKIKIIQTKTINQLIVAGEPNSVFWSYILRFKKKIKNPLIIIVSKKLLKKSLSKTKNKNQKN